MRVLVTLALSFLVTFCHGWAEQGCDLNQEALMKTAMECLAHDPSLMLQVIEHMEHPDQMANMKFVCSNQEGIITVAMCMEKKMIGCLPEEVRSVAKTLVVRERLEAVLRFACQHKAELMSNCMDETSTAEFSECLSSKGQDLMTALAGPQVSTLGVQGVLCSYSTLFKTCLAAHSGTCSKDYINVYDELFEMLLPEHRCDKASLAKMDNGPASKLLGSLLMHGQPMLGQANRMGPVYKMAQKKRYNY